MGPSYPVGVLRGPLPKANNPCHRNYPLSPTFPQLSSPGEPRSGLDLTPTPHLPHTYASEEPRPSCSLALPSRRGTAQLLIACLLAPYLLSCLLLSQYHPPTPAPPRLPLNSERLSNCPTVHPTYRGFLPHSLNSQPAAAFVDCFCLFLGSCSLSPPGLPKSGFPLNACCHCRGV